MLARSAAILALLFVTSAGPLLADDPAPRVIVGLITDAEGNPLSGALVEWGYFKDEADQRESTTTGADGRYRLEVKQVGRDYRLGASKSGHAPRWIDGLIPGPPAEPSEVDLSLRTGATARIRITSPAGQPVPDVQVTPLTPGGGFHSSFSMPIPATPFPGPLRTSTTDSDGWVTLADLPPRPQPVENTTSTVPIGGIPAWITLAIRQDGNWVSDEAISIEAAASDEPLVVELPGYRVPGFDERQHGIVLGRAVDAETGEPLSEFSVTRRHVQQPTHVDAADGRFQLGGKLTEGRAYEVRVFAKGYAVATARLTAAADDNAEEVTIKLERSPSFEGQLVDAMTGDPLAGVALVTGYFEPRSYQYIEWSSLGSFADGSHSLHNVLRVVTDADGRFTVPETPDYHAVLVFRPEGYEWRVIRPPARPETGPDGICRIEVQPESVVEAVILRETQLGASADYVSLYVSTDNGVEHMFGRLELDESGKVTIPSLAAGQYRLVLMDDQRNFGFPCYTKAIALGAGERKEVFLGDMPGTLTLSGQADPFAMVRISPEFDAEIGGFAVMADVDGRFTLSELFPGRYTVGTDTSSAARGSISHTARSETIDLTGNQEVDLRSRFPTR